MEDATRDSGGKFDMVGFLKAAKQEEQERARASWKGGSQKSASAGLPGVGEDGV